MVWVGRRVVSILMGMVLGTYDNNRLCEYECIFVSFANICFVCCLVCVFFFVFLGMCFGCCLGLFVVF